MSLEQTYKLITEHIPKTQQIDSLTVVKQVEQYRQWWRPKKGDATVFLLGESHVSTSDKDFKIQCNNLRILPQNYPKGYPMNFVKAVYCFGNGEYEILSKKPLGKGMSQFWQVFSSCIGRNPDDILRSKRDTTTERLWKKVEILQEMKDKGIWLMDASIIGLKKPPRAKKGLSQEEKEERKRLINQEMNKTLMSPKTIEKIILTSWRSYLQKQILDDKPKHIIVIGNGVEKILGKQLKDLEGILGIGKHSVLSQPNAGQDDYEKYYQEYQKICSKYVSLTHAESRYFQSTLSENK